MIPNDIYKQGVMLCAPSKDVASTPVQAVEKLVTSGRYVFDYKYDGIRALAFIDNGQVKLINRIGRDITFRYPEIVVALSTAYPTMSIVLDGEIVVFKDNGEADFAASHRRDAQQSERTALALAQTLPATLMAFDILYCGGDDLRKMPYKARHAILSVQAATAFQGSSTLRWSMPDKDGAARWQEIVDKGLEGLVAKSVLAPYRAGRRPDWVKIKLAFQVSVVATGRTVGKGSRKSKFGAIEMSMVNPDGSIRPVGEVGTGFKDRDLDDIGRRMDAGELLVIEVELAALTKEGKFRFPSFKGVRTDKVPTDCTIDQLDGIPIIK